MNYTRSRLLGGKESGGGRRSCLSATAGEENSLARSPLLPHEWESPRTGPGEGGARCKLAEVEPPVW